MGDDITPTELTTKEAIALTKKIRGHVESAWALLLEARDRGAWRRMNYPSFDAYARGEFDMTRGNAYKLIAQGEVIAALEAAKPADDVYRARYTQKDVSARQAAKLKQNPDAMEQAKAFVAAGTPAKEAAAKAIVDVESKAAKPKPEQLTLDFEVAQLNDLVRLGKPRLLAVQRKINNALDVIRRG